MTSVFSWQNSVNLCLASFCTSRPNLPVTPASLDLLFCIPVLYNEKDIFSGCQLQKILYAFIKPFNFSFFSITVRGIDQDYCVIEWLALETNKVHPVVLDIASTVEQSGVSCISSISRTLIFQEPHYDFLIIYTVSKCIHI